MNTQTTEEELKIIISALVKAVRQTPGGLVMLGKIACEDKRIFKLLGKYDVS